MNLQQKENMLEEISSKVRLYIEKKLTEQNLEYLFLPDRTVDFLKNFQFTNIMTIERMNGNPKLFISSWHNFMNVEFHVWWDINLGTFSPEAEDRFAEMFAEIVIESGGMEDLVKYKYKRYPQYLSKIKK